MKYKALYNSNDFINEENLLERLLINRNVIDPQRLLTLSEKEIHSGMLFKNMDKALEIFHKHILNNNTVIHIIVDSDNDGLASAALIYQYIKDLNINIKVTYSLHSGKQHGIILEELEKYKFDLLIVPDAGTNDFRSSRILYDKNIDILILDHHNIQQENKYATVINCKDGQYPNDTLSGAGVVYKFCKEYDIKYNYNFADKYLDLLSLGCIGDMCDLRNYETRYLVLKGLNQFGKYNNFLQEIMDKQDYSLKNKITIMGVGWYISPLLNAVIRIGTYEEKLNVFRALIEEQEEIEYQPRRKSKDDPKPDIEIHSLQKTMARICGNLKAKQDTLVKKGVELLNAKIKEKNLDKSKILIVDCTDILENTFTGLVANKLAEYYKRPVILLRKKGQTTYGGSCRNYNLFPIDNFQAFLNDLDTFNELGGHDDAFGFEITKENIILTHDKANEILKNVAIEDVYKVDYEIPVGRLKVKYVEQVAQWQNLWGNKLHEPLFAITDIYISTDKIKLIGSKKNIIKFESNNITFIKKYANEEIYNNMILKQTKGLSKKRVERVKIDIIGKFVENEWDNNKYTQIEIIDYNVKEDNEILF